MHILLASKTGSSRKKVGFGTLPKLAKKPLPPLPPLTPASGGWTSKFLFLVLVSLFFFVAGRHIVLVSYDVLLNCVGLDDPEVAHILGTGLSPDVVSEVGRQVAGHVETHLQTGGLFGVLSVAKCLCCILYQYRSVVSILIVVVLICVFS